MPAPILFTVPRLVLRIPIVSLDVAPLVTAVLRMFVLEERQTEILATSTQNAQATPVWFLMIALPIRLQALVESAKQRLRNNLIIGRSYPFWLLFLQLLFYQLVVFACLDSASIRPKEDKEAELEKVEEWQVQNAQMLTRLALIRMILQGEEVPQVAEEGALVNQAVDKAVRKEEADTAMKIFQNLTRRASCFIERSFPKPGERVMESMWTSPHLLSFQASLTMSNR